MRTITIESDQIHSRLEEEWLVTNGIGGFACGTLCGVPMRKYHSLLDAALPAPHGRTIMLNYISDKIIADGKETLLSCIQQTNHMEINSPLTNFRLDDGIPFWRYEFNGIVIEKSLFLIHRQNTLCITYKIITAEKPIEMKWRPYFHFRFNGEEVDIGEHEKYQLHTYESQYEIESPNFPTLRMYMDSTPAFLVEPKVLENVFYKTEADRGYPSVGNLSSPGYFIIPAQQGDVLSFIVSTESWDTIKALTIKDAFHVERLRKRNLIKTAGSIAKKSPAIGKLILAADQFLMTPVGRYRDMIRLQAAGEEVRSVIAGFPWFTDWGRDTMISLEGLTLCTGRSRDAFAILHTFAYYVRNGLIPNMFPDGQLQGIYNTADATLWFFHAIDRYIETTGDIEIIEFLLPTLQTIIYSHLHGTDFGIKVAEDGLLMQGEMGFQLTWMDAKVGDWVVTPRRGKAVEINALWYNALRLFEQWSGKKLDITELCRTSFNQKFWNEKEQHLYDVIDGENGNDSALRPNQLFAISLRYPVLEEKHWKPVVQCIHDELLTPLGLRTLSPKHPDYKAYYDGDLRSRDAAYHQGTVWPWLIGPYIDAWLKVYPEDIEGARKLLTGLEQHLNQNCIGTIGEIFDATPPYSGRGCFAQAWSVAELLRCLIKTHPKE